MKPSNLFKNLSFSAIFAVITVFFFLCAATVFWNIRLLSCVHKFWARSVLFFARLIFGISHRINSALATNGGGFIIASKHQSMWETVFFLMLFPKVSFVIKKELLRIPFYGWTLKHAGMIPVDRKGGIRSMRKMLNDMEERLRDGFCIVIFPQGTRVPFQKSTQEYPYKISFYPLYNEGYKIIPLDLDSGKYWPKGIFSQKTPGEIRVDIKDAVPSGLSQQEFRRYLEKELG